MAKVIRNGVMDQATVVIMKKDRRMPTGYINGQMENNITATGKMTKNMETVKFTTLMVDRKKAFGKMENAWSKWMVYLKV